MQSPDPNELPADIGTFDFVHVGAVYEHLLPAERRRLLPQLWSVLKVGGVLFVNQLPHRFYVVEDHTTGVPLLNFLPDRLAHKAATRFSDRVADDATWPELLRAGIRGGTQHSDRPRHHRGRRGPGAAAAHAARAEGPRRPLVRLLGAPSRAPGQARDAHVVPRRQQGETYDLRAGPQVAVRKRA